MTLLSRIAKPETTDSLIDLARCLASDENQRIVVTHIVGGPSTGPPRFGVRLGGDGSPAPGFLSRRFARMPRSRCP